MASRLSGRRPRLAVAMLAACLASEPGLSAFRARTLAGILFVTAPHVATDPGAPGPDVMRSREVAIDMAALLAARPDDRSTAVAPALLINLFDDLAVAAVADRIDPAEGGLTWVGHVQGVEGSSVTLACVNGVMTGTITMPDAVFTVRYLGDQIHQVAQLDQTRQRRELEPVPIAPVAAGVIRGQDLQQQAATASPVGEPTADMGRTADQPSRFTLDVPGNGSVAGLATAAHSSTVLAPPRRAQGAPAVRAALPSASGIPPACAAAGVELGSIDPMTGTAQAILPSRDEPCAPRAPGNGVEPDSSLASRVEGIAADPVAVLHRGGVRQLVWPDRTGIRLVEIDPEDDVDVTLPQAGRVRYAGYQVRAGERMGLPFGSRFDGEAGTFCWQPAAGFTGVVDLEFAGDNGVVVLVRVVVYFGAFHHA